MKKAYIKPTMQVVQLQQQCILAGSPGGYDNQNLGMPGGEINIEGEVF